MLTAVTCGLLISAAAPSFAMVDPPPGTSSRGSAACAGGTEPTSAGFLRAHTGQPAVSHVITMGGLPRWEVAWIAIGAAVFAAVLAYRVLARRRPSQLAAA